MYDTLGRLLEDSIFLQLKFSPQERERLASILSKYDDIGREDGIVDCIVTIAHRTNNKEATMLAADAIDKYEKEAAYGIVRSLYRASKKESMNGMSKVAVEQVAELVSDKELVELINGSGESRYSLGCQLGEIAYFSRDARAVKKAVQTIRNYKGNAQDAVGHWLSKAAAKDGDVVFNVATCLKKVTELLQDEKIYAVVNCYEGGVLDSVADGIAASAYYTKDHETVRMMAENLDLYGREHSGGVAEVLGTVSQEFRNPKGMEKAIGLLKKAGPGSLDIINGIDLIHIVKGGFTDFVTDARSLEAAALYVKSGKRLPKPVKELSKGSFGKSLKKGLKSASHRIFTGKKPDMPFEATLEDYIPLAKKYVSNNYGIGDIDARRLLLFFSAKEDYWEQLAKYQNERKEEDVHYYSIKVGESARGIVYGRDELLRHSVIAVIGSRDREKETKAVEALADIVGDKTVNRARNEFNGKHKKVLKDVIAAFRGGDVDGARKLLESTGEDSILQVLRAPYFDEDSSSSTVLKAVESKNPLDYDARVQMACVYLPDTKDHEILKYANDPSILLVRYDIGGKTMGSAICYREKGVFLVDSIEGHRTFRKDSVFSAVHDDLVVRAKERGDEVIVFNDNPLNRTSKYFLGYLRERGAPGGSVLMDLDTVSYLDADENAEGFVELLLD